MQMETAVHNAVSSVRSQYEMEGSGKIADVHNKT
jgi:cation transport regulator ChaB